jgi:hemin uptake protein HemP
MNARPARESSGSQTAAGALGHTPASIDSAELLRGAVEIRIRHHSEEYRLRVTRQNKLILTK